MELESSVSGVCVIFSDGVRSTSTYSNRKYQIATMDVESYSRSEKFFWQWRLLTLMEKIGKQYPYIPPKKRTPRWFVEKYMAGFACPPEDRYRRLIFDEEEDTDVDETGKTVIPRHLLKPHMSEILGLFAAHAGWFITNNVARRNKLFDITSWETFAKEARKQRREAARQGVRWGWPEGEGVEEESSGESEGGGDELNDLVRKNPVTGKANEIVARKLELARVRSERGIGPRFSSDSGSDGDAPGGAEYASDFLESSDEENDSDNQLAEEEAANQIPWELQLPPLLPDVDGRWWCPLQECNHQIDLYDLTEEDRRGVPEELVEYILQKEWRNAAYDNKVLHGFRLMVTNHYSKHLEERGVKFEKREGKASYFRFLENTRLMDRLQVRVTFINGRRRRRGDEEPIRGPMPIRGALGGESRIVPIVHAPQAGHFR